MATSLQSLIDRVIGKKGVLRAPSWWMHKILSDMAYELEGMVPMSHDFNDDFNEDFAL